MILVRWALGAVVLLGCGPGGAGPLALWPPIVALEAGAETYPAGAEVSYALRNLATPRAGYNLCFTGAQVLEGGGWRPHEDDPFWRTVDENGVAYACTAELRILGSFEVAEFRNVLAADLAPGSYRLFTDIEAVDYGGQRFTIVSDSFIVE